jgi:hypothetical protein
VIRFLVPTLLILALTFPTGDASARRQRLKPDGTRFIAWAINMQTISGGSDDTTLTIRVVDAVEEAREASRAKRRRARNRYTVRVKVNGRSIKRKGQTVVLPLRRGEHEVRVELRDRYGGDWTGTMKVERRTQVTLTLNSRWTKPSVRGRFVNWTHRCPKKKRHMLKFAIKIPGDLYVGESVKIRPGKAKRGPELPEGEYHVEMHEYRARKWHLRDPGRLIVGLDKPWKFIGTCELGNGLGSTRGDGPTDTQSR